MKTPRSSLRTDHEASQTLRKNKAQNLENQEHRLGWSDGATPSFGLGSS
ncbi:hypothetical protein [Flavivirga sp. 57AJ16]|nr:hypothetical protein [Flavivirga sp. 57AJ16]MDD7887565.1 hypothetical protein [Flavivirga sp. 57AJ16]